MVQSKIKTVTAGKNYTEAQARTSISEIEIEYFNNKYQVVKNLDIYVDGSNFVIDPKKAVDFYNTRAFGTQSKLSYEDEYDADGKKTGRKIYKFSGATNGVPPKVVNAQRDAFRALLVKAKANTKKSLSEVPSPNMSKGQSSTDLYKQLITYGDTIESQAALSEQTGMKVTDSTKTAQANKKKKLEEMLKRTINYEGSVLRIFNNGTEYSEELNNLKNQTSSYVSSYFVDGQELPATVVNTPYSKSEFDVYINQEINKREAKIADTKVPYRDREYEVKIVARAAHNSDGQIRTPYIDKLYKDVAQSEVYVTTLTEAQNQADLARTIGLTMQKSPASSWVMDKSLRERATLLRQELQESVDKGEFGMVEAMNRYRAFTNMASQQHQNNVDTVGGKAMTVWVKNADGDLEPWHPADERMGTGTLRLLDYDTLQYNELSEDTAKETILGQTMLLSNDWLLPTADAVRIKVPAGLTQDKTGGVTDKIFAKLAIELKDTSIVPDDYESSNMVVAQGSVGGKTYTYVSIVDDSGKPLAMISMSDEDLKRGLTPEEQRALSNLKKERAAITRKRNAENAKKFDNTSLES
jgi:hypothetical protein